ncbi:hypothetical protein NNO07_09570 [Pseudomonas resinovorans]|uniref:Uncharacterized protein n=1 Tax=Metapseudomonas resinovorans TaxID=53412 RepID=A0ABT4Y387_METRE|nr:hypothetical protein [Pseudomonas resinovorans]MDA8483316.1 hypothetical protein [Pseudomonas resinovorans]
MVVEVTQEGAKPNIVYNPGVPSSLNSAIDQTHALRPAFHPDLPDQRTLKLWTFNGTLPPKLLIGRYHESILFRHHNRLPDDPTHAVAIVDRLELAAVDGHQRFGKQDLECWVARSGNG